MATDRIKPGGDDKTTPKTPEKRTPTTILNPKREPTTSEPRPIINPKKIRSGFRPQIVRKPEIRLGRGPIIRRKKVGPPESRQEDTIQLSQSPEEIGADTEYVGLPVESSGHEIRPDQDPNATQNIAEGEQSTGKPSTGGWGGPNVPESLGPRKGYFDGQTEESPRDSRPNQPGPGEETINLDNQPKGK